MRHIARDAELEVLDQYPTPSLKHAGAMPGVTRSEVIEARHAVRHSVRIDPLFKEALVDVANALRSDERVLQGTSTRSLVLSLPALQAHAVINGRDYVAPDDLETLAPYVFEHRIECVAGIDDAAAIVRDCAKGPIDRLAKESLKK
jgi:MoxR-like ATPase